MLNGLSKWHTGEKVAGHKYLIFLKIERRTLSPWWRWPKGIMFKKNLSFHGFFVRKWCTLRKDVSFLQQTLSYSLSFIKKHIDFCLNVMMAHSDHIAVNDNGIIV